MWYHSSEDTPDKQDPTQYKRAAAVGLGGLAVLATGTPEMAARVVADNLGRGLSRMGESHTKGLGYMADATDGASLGMAYREARNAIQHQASIEKAVVRTAAVLWTNPADGAKKVAAFEPLIDQRAGALLNEVRAGFQLTAMQMGVPAQEPGMTAEEREAANLLVETVARTGGAAPGRTGGPPAAAPGAAPGAAGAPPVTQTPAPSLPEEYGAEFTQLLGKKMTALQIRDFLSGEFTPLPLSTVMAVLRAREAQGSIKLTPIRK
jgi:aminopeptidase YwaD